MVSKYEKQAKEIEIGDLCAYLLETKQFNEYLNLLRAKLDSAEKNYLNYRDNFITPSREDTTRREMYAAKEQLKELIAYPYRKKEKAKRIREKQADIVEPHEPKRG